MNHNVLISSAGRRIGLVEVYRTHIPSIKLAPDASEALQAISHIASIAVISDGSRRQPDQEGRAGFICGADRTHENVPDRVRKPRPKGLRTRDPAPPRKCFCLHWR